MNRQSHTRTMLFNFSWARAQEIRTLPHELELPEYAPRPWMVQPIVGETNVTIP